VPNPEFDAELVPERVATRLLERASEMDVARTSGSSVADLRAAAAEAGISAQSFDAALAEMQGEARVDAQWSPPRPHRRWLTWALAAVVLLPTAALVASRLAPITSGVASSVPLVEEAIVLGCLTPDEAGALIRPVLRDAGSKIVANSARAPRVITITATPDRMQAAKAVLAKNDAEGSPSCVARSP
jgi:hypothetical protein